MFRQMILVITALLLLFVGLVVGIGWYISAPVYSGPSTPHFTGKKFVNKGEIEAGGFLSVIKWLLNRDSGPWTKSYEKSNHPKPVASSDRLVITFVNHSTFLIQWNDLNILTDPIWSERCSPFSFAGPQRMKPPGIPFDELPEIDMILISHNHYDHLDLPTVIDLNKTFNPLFIVPLGVGAFLKNNGIEKVVELDWWEETRNGVTIKAVPAQHFSGRGMFDRDATLWCGYVLQHEGWKVYFAGDSGYGPLFSEIGKREGPMNVSIIPIGAYLPEWFMSPIHISPAQAVQVHKDVKSAQSIAMHFGTFPLADEGQGKAEEDLILALDRLNVSQKEFLIPEEGVALKFETP